MKAPGGSPAVVGFCIETCSGPAVERLLEANLPVFPLNPKAAERYRDRKAPAGAKSDRLDAFCFADTLRTDGHLWRPLRPQVVNKKRDRHEPRVIKDLQGTYRKMTRPRNVLKKELKKQGETVK